MCGRPLLFFSLSTRPSVNPVPSLLPTVGCYNCSYSQHSVGMLTTRLIGLEVHASGSAQQESLASYFHRVRLMNHGRARQWLSHINRPNPIHDTKLLWPGSRKSKLVIDWLIDNGCPNDVSDLGWFRDDAIGTLASCRRGRAWCHLCLQNNPGYEPVIWSFSAYRACHVHRTSLLTSCPSCGWVPRYLTSQTHIPGHCDRCGLRISVKTPTEKPTDFDLFAAEAISRWQVAYQKRDLANSLTQHFSDTTIKHPDPMRGAVYASWLSGYDLVSGTPLQSDTPRHALPLNEVSRAEHRYVLRAMPELSGPLKDFIADDQRLIQASARKRSRKSLERKRRSTSRATNR